MRFAFEAVSETGVREQGEIAAADERTALKALAARGLTVVALSQLAAAPPSLRSARISAGDRALAVRQLSGRLYARGFGCSFLDFIVGMFIANFEVFSIQFRADAFQSFIFVFPPMSQPLLE